ncbi:diiron oxygenase [Streptomyces sp. NPDC051243]|uniref:diiron oxygenase n=1 Tax=Streptomyces sp. NPDC051243 TaxID=3365646 RepID=UPI0037AD08D9
MCGTVGLFLGCSAVALCPRQFLAQRREETPDGTVPDTYVSPFRSWYDRSAVRGLPRREIGEVGAAQRLFPLELVPLARHPLVLAKGPDVLDQVVVRQLYRYFDFTAQLEQLVVNRTVLGIAHGTVGVHLPDEMRLDAHKIYCDEAYHALFSADLLHQVRRLTGIDPGPPRQPFFLSRLERYLGELPAELRPLAEVLFVVVSETLISAHLTDLPDDDDVVPAVRDAVRDHARDEGRHHTYFALFLRYLWGQLDPGLRTRAALMVPEFIHIFTAPDIEAVHEELLGYGLTEDQARQVVAEIHPEADVRAYAADVGRQTVRHFAGVGALDEPQVLAAFTEGGLLLPDPTS